MTATTPTHVDTSIPELWAQRVLRDHVRAGFWGKFCGGPGSPIVQQMELLNAPGDTIHIQTTTPLVGAGISGDVATLEGNEENLTTGEILVVPTLYRHGVLIHRRANKKSIIQLREEAKMRLGEWGVKKADDLRWTNLYSTAAMNGQTYTPNAYHAAGRAGTSTITAADTLKVAEIRKARAKLLNQRATPFLHNGGEYFFMVASPEQILDLKGDSEYNLAVQQAMPRGTDNPIFTGAIAAIDGVVIYEHYSVPVVTNWGAGAIAGATALMFGKEFAVEGLDENVSWAEDEFDYKHKWGVGYAFATQTRRALELNSVQVRTARTVVLP